MELKDTIKEMTSSNYKERFKAEYDQLTIRIFKLETIINKYLNNQLLEFELDTPINVLFDQLIYMTNYRSTLILRAKYEDIDLFIVKEGD